MNNLPTIGYWLAAWGIIIIVLIGLSRTSWGKVIIYYIAWLGIIFIVVTHSNDITNIFQQGNITAGEQ